MAPPHALGESNSRQKPQFFGRGDTKWLEQIESHSSQKVAVRPAKVIDSAKQDSDAYQTAVVSPQDFNLASIADAKTNEEAVVYWKRQLAGAKRAAFPAERETRRGSRSGQFDKIETTVEFSSQQGGDRFTIESIIRASWALILLRYCETDDGCFGVAVSERNGRPMACVPLRVEVNRKESVAQYLSRIQSQEAEMRAFEHYGLRNLELLSPEIRDVCQFSSLLLVERGLYSETDDQTMEEPVLSMDESTKDVRAALPECPLFVRAQRSGPSSVELTLHFDTTSIAAAQVEALSHQLGHVIRQFHETELTLTVQDIAITSPWDVEQVRRWNQQQRAFYDDVGHCPHECFMEQARKTPDTEAIFSTGTTLTYRQLDAQSDAVARYLIRRGVAGEGGVVVPFCVGKSALAIVVMLGISKTGATFVHLDSTHPPARRQALCDLVRAKHIVASPSLAPQLQDMGQETITISEIILHSTAYDGIELPIVSPRSDMYIIFSSGSTGTPKCIPMQHGAATSTLTAQLDALAVPNRVRMLQFTSFNFDVSIIEAFLVFFTGGTLCVPCERERLETTAAFAAAARANYAILTPSFAQTMKPQEYPMLETLVLFGEKLTTELVRVWQGTTTTTTTLINSYGLTESGMLNTAKRVTAEEEGLPTDVGRGFNCHCWIVEPDDHERLAPVGCVGELVLHGFAMSRGFLDAPDLTARSFPPRVSWDKGRLGWKYNRTGDMARFLPNGNIEIIGRSDTQIKIRGRRVDVAEIESAIRQASDRVLQVAVDLITMSSRRMLIAFVEVDNAGLQGDPDDILLPQNKDTTEMFHALQRDLQRVLPTYMVPLAYIPLRSMPFAGSMKTDRRRLGQLALQLTPEAVSSYGLLESETVEPTTEMELLLRELWAEVLDVSPQRIGRTTTLMDAGGDSIHVIQLATLARQHGLALSAAQIFRYTRLQDMAAIAMRCTPQEADGMAKPLELVKELVEDEDMDAMVEEVRVLCSLDAVSEVEDVLPALSLQEGLMVEEIKYPGTYTAHRVHRLPDNVDITRLKEAWEQTVEACACLRTRIVRVQGHTLQVVVKGARGWLSDIDDLAGWEPSEPAKLPSVGGGLGQPLCQYGIVKRDGRFYFIWSLHHAIYDGWTLGLISTLLQDLYEDLDFKPAVTSPTTFIRSIQTMNSDNAADYWRSELRDAKPALFPSPLPVRNIRKRATHAIHTHEFASTTSSPITKATILRAAWGILLAKYSDSDDVCFGQVLSGRQADVAGIERMPGLALATVPARMRLIPTQPVQDMLLKLQEEGAISIQFEQFGLPNIAQVSPEAKEACQFTSMFAVQPSVHDFFARSRLISLENDIQDSLPEYLSYSLSLQVETRPNRYITYFTYDADVFHAQQIETMAHQYARIVEQLVSPGSLTVGDISAVSQWDIQQINSWNNEWVVEPVEACLHELLSEALQAQPDKTAIVTTAESMSYKELDDYSTKFAQYLVSIGVKEGMIIPFLFEKSMWAFVAFIGILKAGAAFLPLDISYPEARRRILVEETEAEFMVVSPTQRRTCDDLVKKVIELSPRFFAEQSPRAYTVMLPKVSPRSPVYSFFTSGSTGKPKGIILEHAAVSTSVLAHIKAYGLTQETRILQFCSYMFDIIVIDTFGTLIAGGTICAPAEEERLYDCASFMNSTRVNYAVLTPTFARTLDPNSLTTLKTLLMGAEAIPKDVQDMWYGKVQIKYGYGPTEAAVSNTIYTVASPDTPSTIIGKGFNTDCWIVEPDNHNRLVPVGCVGELVLHGHNLARGYLNNETATEKAFPRDVDWMPRQKGDTRKFYKTGDLVKFRADGNIEFLSRKDTQVKIRGRRIELGEIEAAIKKAHPSATGVAVEVIRLQSRDFLAAFLQAPGASLSTAEDLFLPVDETMQKSMAALMLELNQSIPSYLVPSVYVPISKMPLLPSMKTDRKTLQSIGKRLTSRQMTEYSFTAMQLVKPSTEMEIRLRDLWSRVLKRGVDEIGRHDSFLAVGGDSITAMELVAQARKENLDFTVQDVFRCPRLCDLALAVRETELEKRRIGPFNLLPADDREDVIRQAEVSLQLPAQEQILDLYPATPMQERLMAAAEKSPGSYVALQAFRVLESVDVERFIRAWNMTVEHCVNLRTRLISCAGKSWQVVLRTQQADLRVVDQVQNTSESLKALLLPPMVHGSPLCRFKLVKSESSTCFLLAIHHSIFDGWSINLLLKMLHYAYQSPALPPPVPYTGFIEYLSSQDEDATKKFWVKQLKNARQSMFPPESSAKEAIHDPRLVVRLTKLPSSAYSSITIPSVVRAAWALVLSRHLGTDDVCFCDTMSGRLAPVDGIEHMAGLTISIVPLRVRLDKDQLVKSFLQDVQTLASDVIPHEQYGLHNIGKLGPGYKEAVDCGHVLVVQPLQDMEAQLRQLGGNGGQMLELCFSDDETLLEDAARYDSFPLFVNCQMLESSLRISYVYNAAYMSEDEAIALSHHMDMAITELLGDTEKAIGDVKIASDWDMNQITQWSCFERIGLPEPLSSVLPLDTAPVAYWVLDSQNTSSLAAIGCVGELLLEFDKDSSTPTGFQTVENSLLPATIPCSHYVVRTGQLVRYNAAGSLEYIGKLKPKDELRSQHADVEDFIVANEPGISSAWLEKLAVGSTPATVAFIVPRVPDPDQELDTLSLIESKEAHALVQAIFHVTRRRWPLHRVPRYVIPVSTLHKSEAALYNLKLQLLVNQLSKEQLASFTMQQRDIIAPSSKAEQDLRKLWASVLSLQENDISCQDNFFLVGGDSFTVIQLAGQARRKGLGLTARAVFQRPVLTDMAASLDGQSRTASFATSPFSLVICKDFELLRKAVAQSCGLSDASKVQDVYPCTPMQEGLMALSVTQPGSYINKESTSLALGVDASQFKVAWGDVMKKCEILRTRIVLVDNEAYQVVIDEDATWDSDASPGSANIGYGSRLCYYCLNTEPDGSFVFSLTIHHSIYDGWVLGLISQTLESSYHQRPAPALQPFSGFVNYVNSIDKEAASNYWRCKLQGATPASFPAKMSTERPTQKVFQTMSKTVHFSKDANMAITTANVVLATWSLVMARYSNTDDVCFGSTVSGRQAAVAGLEQMAGPTIATIPIRVTVDKTVSVAEFLQMVQQNTADGAEFEQFGLQNIAKLGQDAKSACDFTSLLIIQASAAQADENGTTTLFVEKSTRHLLDEAASRNFFNYPLVAQVFSSDKTVDLFLSYDAGCVSEGELVAFTHHFEHVLKQLFLETDQSLSQLSQISPWDRDHALQSSKLRVASETCVDWRFEETVQRYGQLPAVNSWDCDFTYRELFDASCSLAKMLQQRGVRQNVVVPLCFAKSAWAIVAMMAVQLAGGAFVPFDPEWPERRLEALLLDVNAPFILASRSLEKKLKLNAIDVVVINKAAIAAMAGDAAFKPPSTHPTDSSFLIFTSGTTGKPKAVDISHAAVCSSSDGYGASLNIGPGTRVFQFSAYTFDVGILDILVTLMRGGCVCVPSDYSRVHDLAASITSTQANWAFLTPTVANLLSPEDVPCLTTLCLGGEAVNQAVVKKWKDAVRLHGLYGPAESSICAWNPRLGLQGKSTNIGRPLSSAFWVVDPANYKQLMPAGCVGELLIQGPLLAQGYREAETEDQEKWLESCDWLPGDSFDRAYLTGDLVRRNADGTYDYVGRKDSQVKLRGQRIETGEVEHHLLKVLQGVKQVVVDIVGSGSTEALAAFVDFGPVKPPTENIERLFGEAQDALVLHLPSIMRPQYFIPVDDIPQTATGKLDRRALKTLFSGIAASDLLQYNVTRTSSSRQCESLLELELRGYWSQVLGLSEEEIGATDNFYNLGGDSIKIVSLVQRIKLSYGDGVGISVFGSSKTTIEVMARTIEAQKAGAKLVETPVHDFYGEIISALESLSDINILEQRCWTTLPHRATVFLTGGTGYLGTEILRQLVQLDVVGTVAVLVRAATQEQALARVRATAETAGWWRPEYEAKIEAWQGDLGKEQLGLTNSRYSRLMGLSKSGNADAIIHNGAVVNWSADFDALKAENVTATVQLLRAAASSPRAPKFVLVSGGTGAKRDGTRSAAAMCADLALQNGYSQTKFVSESIVCEFAQKLQRRRVAVVKPGLIIGSAASGGVANVDDFLWRITAAAVAVGQAPADLGGAGQDWVPLAAVDAVARTVIAPLLVKDGNGEEEEVFTEMTGGMRMPALWQLVGEAAEMEELPLLPYGEWCAAATRQMERVRERHPLWAVRDFLEISGDSAPPEGATTSPPLPGTADAVRASVRYLRRIGFIQASAENFGTAHQRVIGRSGISQQRIVTGDRRGNRFG